MSHARLGRGADAAAHRRRHVRRELRHRLGDLRAAVPRPSRASLLPRMFFTMLPTALIMVMLAALTAILVPSLGVAALAIFALIAVLPQTALTLAGRTRPVASLDSLTATRRYSHALALHLGLDRASAATSRASPTSPSSAAPTPATRSPTPARRCATRRARPGRPATWASGGTAAAAPPGLRGPVTPIASRIVAVADTWSRLTANGGPELSHADALDELENAAGTRFDPRVVQAAYAVVAEERVSAPSRPRAAPAPAAPPGAAAPRHRRCLACSAHDRVDLARVRSQVNSRALARPSGRSRACSAASRQQRRRARRGAPRRPGRPAARRRRAVSGSAVTFGGDDRRPAAIASSTGRPKPS